MYDLRLRITIKIFATSTIAVREMRRFFSDDSVLDISTVLNSGNLSITEYIESWRLALPV